MKHIVKLSLALTLLVMAGIVLSSNAPQGKDKIGEAPGKISFTGIAGWEAHGHFENWEFADLQVPNDDFSEVQATILVSMKSVYVENNDLRKHLLKPDYFGAKKWPDATITIEGALETDDRSFSTMAIVNIKGVEQEVALEFTVSEEKPYHVKGSGELNRRLFNIYGDGPEDGVPIEIDVVLQPELYTN